MASTGLCRGLSVLCLYLHGRTFGLLVVMAEGCGGLVERGFEGAAKMVAIGKAEVIGDGVNGVRGVGKAARGLMDARAADAGAGRGLQVLAKQMGEVLGAVSGFASQLLYRKAMMLVRVDQLHCLVQLRRNGGFRGQVEFAEEGVQEGLYLVDTGIRKVRAVEALPQAVGQRAAGGVADHGNRLLESIEPCRLQVEMNPQVFSRCIGSTVEIELCGNEQETVARYPVARALAVDVQMGMAREIEPAKRAEHVVVIPRLAFGQDARTQGNGPDIDAGLRGRGEVNSVPSEMCMVVGREMLKGCGHLLKRL